MGLDIDGKNIPQEIHFNWSSIESFINWCEENRLPSPFIGWDGTNNHTTINFLNTNQNQDAKEWKKAFENFLNINIKENKIDMKLLLAFNYYLFLNQQLENNGFIKYS